jgi:hypothetical protein
MESYIKSKAERDRLWLAGVWFPSICIVSAFELHFWLCKWIFSPIPYTLGFLRFGSIRTMLGIVGQRVILMYVGADSSSTFTHCRASI